jgi:hypothetical protein
MKLELNTIWKKKEGITNKEIFKNGWTADEIIMIKQFRTKKLGETIKFIPNDDKHNYELVLKGWLSIIGLQTELSIDKFLQFFEKK